ncbi:MAG: hypothetical protein RI894_1494 [Bacteroidota bacterium]|jgi:opacity protein-like surface antigen
MKKLIFVALIGIFTTNIASAQYFDVGLMGGVTWYEGELAHTFDGTLKEMHPSFGLLARYNMTEQFSVRANFLYAAVSGRDLNSPEPAIRNRGLSFRSDIYELGAQVEFNILGYQPYALSSPFSPYVFIGISGFKFNPQAYYNNDWVDLQPLGTEGQGMPNRDSRYSLIAMAIPFGGGVKYALNDLWTLGAEVGLRPTFTDYLDDVGYTYVNRADLTAANGKVAAALGNKINAPTDTKRGDARNNDWYNFIGLTITYNFLDNGLVGARNHVRQRAGCKQARF